MTRDETVALYLECQAKAAAARAAAPESDASDAGEEAAKAHWNAWALAMLAERRALEADGRWAEVMNSYDALEPANPETAAWFEKARTDFRSCRFLTKEAAATAEPAVVPPDLCFCPPPMMDVEFQGNFTDFDGFVFPDTADFDCAQFPCAVRFAGTLFNHNASFRGCRFPDNATFSCKILGDADFDSAHFDGQAFFAHTEFSGYAGFSFAVFAHGAARAAAAVADFRCAEFKGAGHFEGTEFKGLAYFAGSNFTRAAIFRGAQFDGGVDFAEARFAARSYFNQVRFGDNASVLGRRDYYGNIVFGGGTVFRGVQFGGDSDFENTQFTCAADFLGAGFGESANFAGSVFSADAGFRGVRFGGQAAFGAASFKSSTVFSGARFMAAADFAGLKADRAFFLTSAEFAQVPCFSEADFACAPNLEGIALPMPGLWCKGDAQAAPLYRAIRYLAARRPDRACERMAIKGELRSRRLTADKLWHPRMWAGFFYDAVSDCGRSIARPLAVWLVLLALFPAVYLVGAGVAVRDWNSDCAAAGARKWELAASMSISAGTPLIGSPSTEAREFAACLGPGAAVPLPLSALQAAQTLASAVLILWLLLAVRNADRAK
jgi:hypothetical protein